MNGGIGPVGAAAAVTLKDLRLLGRDRRTAAMLLILPLVFITIIGLATGKFPGLGGAAPAARVAVVDRINYGEVGTAGFADPPGEPLPPGVLPSDPLDPADAETERTHARNLVVKTAAFLNDRGFRTDSPEHWASILGGDLRDPLPGDGEAAARLLLDRGLVDAVVVFGPNFYRRAYALPAVRLLEDRPTAEDSMELLDIEVAGGGSAGLVRAAVEGAVRKRVSQLRTCRSPVAALAVAPVCDRLAEEAAGGPLPLPISEPVEDQGVAADVYDEIVPQYTTMFVFFLVNLMARSFLAERELGTLRRLRTAPVRPGSILVGKTLPFFLLSVAQTAVLFLAGRFLFGMGWGPRPWLLVPVILACSAAATGLGLLIATLVKSDAQVSAYATSVVIVLAGVSGCFMPRDWLPDAMQTASLVTPHAWALIGYDQVLNTPSPDPGVVLRCAGVLLLFAAGFYAIGAWRFGREVG